MKKRLPPGRIGIDYSDEWHTRLLSDLNHAETSSSPELLAAIAAIEALLQANDECIHTVTIKLQIPAHVNDKKVINSILNTRYRENVSLVLRTDKSVEVSVTIRVSRDFVERHALWIVSPFRE